MLPLDEKDILANSSQIWHIFEGQNLFSVRGPNGDQLSEYHLAEMCAILGSPPLDYLQRTETSWEYFEPHGTWKAETSIPEISLKTSERRLSGDNKSQVLTFLRKMLQWLPETRHMAAQLLEDPWLNS